MSLTTIAARLPDKPIKLDESDKPNVLRNLKIVYEGGSLDGKNADFPTRDLSHIVVSLHRGHWHFFETYKRTIWVNLRNRRTIFHCAGVTSKSNNSSWWKELLAVLRIRKLKLITVPGRPN